MPWAEALQLPCVPRRRLWPIRAIDIHRGEPQSKCVNAYRARWPTGRLKGSPILSKHVGSNPALAATPSAVPVRIHLAAPNELVTTERRSKFESVSSTFGKSDKPPVVWCHVQAANEFWL